MYPKSVSSVPIAEPPPVLVDVRAGTDTAAARLAVFGELEQSSARPLERAVLHVLREQRPGHLELDLAGVPVLDTGGIRTLLQCQAGAHQLACRLTLVNVTPYVYRVLEIVRLLEPFDVPRR